jgi:alanine dehydrogenase
MKLADKGLAAFDRDPHLAAGLNVKEGRIMHQAVAASLGFDSLDRTKSFRVAAE